MVHRLETSKERRVELRGLAEELGEGLTDAVEVFSCFESLGSLEGRREVSILTEAFTEVLP